MKIFIMIIVFTSSYGHIITAGISTFPQLTSFPFSTTFSVFPLPSASTSPGCGSLPSGMTQILIPEGSGLLEILPELSCSFPLTLIKGHENERDALGDLYFRQNLLYLHCKIAPNFP